MWRGDAVPLPPDVLQYKSFIVSRKLYRKIYKNSGSESPGYAGGALQLQNNSVTFKFLHKYKIGFQNKFV